LPRAILTNAIGSCEHRAASLREPGVAGILDDTDTGGDVRRHGGTSSGAIVLPQAGMLPDILIEIDPTDGRRGRSRACWAHVASI
jgi:hypothetical protein